MFALNRHRDFIKKPTIAALPVSLPYSPRILRTKSRAPLANRFVGHRNSTFCKEIFDVTETECESMIEPYRVGNDVGRKTIAAIRECLFHADIVAKSWVT